MNASLNKYKEQLARRMERTDTVMRLAAALANTPVIPPEVKPLIELADIARARARYEVLGV